MQRNRLITLLCLVFFCVFSNAQTLSQQKQKRSMLEKDIAILQKQLGSNESQASQALSAISIIQAQKQSRQRLVKEADEQISAMDRQIEGIKAEVGRKQEVLDTLQAHYSRLVMGAYKNRDIKLWYMYILASENISQAFRRFGYFKNLSSSIQTQAEKVNQAKLQLSQKKEELQQGRAQVAKMRSERAKELEKLKADETAQNKLVARLKKDKKAYQASLRAKQTEMRAIDRQIAQMLEQASGKKKSGGKGSKPVDYTLDKNFEDNMGKLPWPVDGPVTEHFGAYQNKELHLSLFNNGINIATEPEAVVRCVFDGVVSNVMLAPGYGQCILVQHGSYYTTYCKVKNATVRQGDTVKTGQALGEVSTIMGKTQLYFLIYKKKYLDPEKWLRDR